MGSDILNKNKITLFSKKDLDGLIKKIFLPELLSSNNFRVLFLLQGEMGSGKTQFVKSLCAQLGVMDVTSPTYSIIQEYESEKIGPIHHIDLFRIEDLEDLESTGFWEILDKERGPIFIEWPQLLKEDFELNNWKKIFINIEIKDSQRILTYLIS